MSSSGKGTRTPYLATLAFAQTTPNAELLAVREGVLQAVVTHDAPAADLFGLTS